MTDKNRYADYTVDEAIAEANRCLGCEDPPCEKGCFSGVPIKEFIRRIRMRDFRGAAQVIRRANPFGATCGFVCETSVLCAGRCILGTHGKRPVDIGGLQAFVMEWDIEHGAYIEHPEKDDSGLRVAVVGSGPAGLSAARELVLQGVEVDVFEREQQPGGVMVRGIPTERLPRHIVESEIQYITEMGARLHLGQKPDINTLLKDYDGVILSVGFGKPRPMGIPGENLDGVMDSVELFTLVEQTPEESKPWAGKRVVVVGGGNTSMDAATDALRLGAEEVTLIYRRSEREMPAWGRELQHAKDMGVIFRPLTAPVSVEGQDGRVTSITVRPMKLGAKGEDGRRRPEPAGEPFVLEADYVIAAIGEGPDEQLLTDIGLSWPILSAPKTPVDKLYVAGDIAPGGPKTVVKAVGEGKRAAQAFLEDHSVSTQVYSFRPSVDLSVEQAGVKFENPFILAATPSTDDLDMVRRAFKAGWAGAVLKTTSVEGTPVDLKYPMMAGYDMPGRKLAALSNIDLISEHHADVIVERIRALKEEFPEKVVIASMMAATREEWTGLARRLVEAGADVIECSFSCPQGSLGEKPGAMLGQNPELSREVTKWVREGAGDVPVFIKITPQVTDIVEVAQAVKEGGADGVCASNTIPSLVGIDSETLTPYPTVGGKTSYGGLSGPAIKPITLRNIAEIAKNVPDLLITGTGGPVSAMDAVEFLGVGCTTVQFGTAVMEMGFGLIDHLKDGLAWYMLEHGYSNPLEIRGKVLEKIALHEELEQPGKVVAYVDQDLCIGCGRCHIACRDGGHQAISFNPEDRRVEVDPERCVGCAFCTSTCPVTGALTMRYIND